MRTGNPEGRQSEEQIKIDKKTFIHVRNPKTGEVHITDMYNFKKSRRSNDEPFMERISDEEALVKSIPSEEEPVEEMDLSSPSPLDEPEVEEEVVTKPKSNKPRGGKGRTALSKTV